MPTKSECFTAFHAAYESGDTGAAVSQLLTGLELSYPDLEEEGNLSQQGILHYVDALTYGTAFEGWLTNQWLASYVPNATPEFVDQAHFDRSVLYICSLVQSKSPTDMIERFIGQQNNDDARLLQAYFASESLYELPEAELDFITEEAEHSLRYLATLDQLLFSQNISAFAKQRRALISQLTIEPSGLVGRPTVPVSYPIEPTTLTQQIQEPKENETALFFMEPWDVDWEELLSPLEAQPTLFVFRSHALFFQCLQFDAVLEALLKKNHAILVLNKYPGPQLAAQPITSRFPTNLTWTLPPLHSLYAPHSDALLEAIGGCLTLDREQKKRDTDSSDALYRIGDKLHLDARARTLGPSRFAALIESMRHYHWSIDPHKGISHERRKWIAPYLDQVLAPLPPRPPRRPERKEGTKRIAHIVPQVIDGNHAPSMLLENILTHHNKELFTPFLYSTESFALRGGQYPVCLYASPLSATRAPKRLKHLEKQGVQIHLEDGQGDYYSVARSTASFLEEFQIDIAVFHSVDVIHLLAQHQTSVPKIVQFDHGTLPAVPGPDLIVVSSTIDSQELDNLARELHCKVAPLSFVIDVRKQWSVHPPQKESLGIPKEAKVLTTISNHLEVRLSGQMKDAIIAILKQVPDAYYMPMGPILKPESFLQPFHEKGVGDRVRPLGLQASPSNLARAMDLYLNEFPFGSGLALLDAMAAGLPIITMYDPDGPAQAQYGARYFGEDRALQAGDIQGYIDLACSLLTDDEKHAEWARIAQERYKDFADIPSYVASLEQLLIH